MRETVVNINREDLDIRVDQSHRKKIIILLYIKFQMRGRIFFIMSI